MIMEMIIMEIMITMGVIIMEIMIIMEVIIIIMEVTMIIMEMITIIMEVTMIIMEVIMIIMEVTMIIMEVTTQAVTGANVQKLAGGEPKSELRQNQQKISETANLKIAHNKLAGRHFSKGTGYVVIPVVTSHH